MPRMKNTARKPRAKKYNIPPIDLLYICVDDKNGSRNIGVMGTTSEDRVVEIDLFLSPGDFIELCKSMNNAQARWSREEAKRKKRRKQ